ncbi:MAG: radical SAM protein, partial [Chitinophagales bacterium]|nr:radical SAM protein [Chitinophagales bacterium]
MAGIYLHIPFCRQACTYCNFHFSTLVKNKDAVIAAMLKEIRLRSDFFPEKTEIETIYFGGGTPSLLSAGEINAFISTIGAHFAISENPEITLEANPDDLSETYLQELKAATPVNRLSIGIQSFFEEDLQYMHRAHNAEQALQCLLRAQAAGFHELSIDLIYGTPTLSDEHWRQNL